MIESIQIVFKKIDSKTWSNSEYQVLVKAVDYTEHDNDFFGENQVTQFKPLEIALKNMKRAKESIAKTEAILSFIETNKPERWQLVFFLEETKTHHSNSALNSITIYL